MPVRGIWMKMKLSRPFEQLNYHLGYLGSWSCFETSKERKIELKKEPKTKKERIRCEMPHGVQLQSIQPDGGRLSVSHNGAQDCGMKYGLLACMQFPASLRCRSSRCGLSRLQVYVQRASTTLQTYYL